MKKEPEAKGKNTGEEKTLAEKNNIHTRYGQMQSSLVFPGGREKKKCFCLCRLWEKLQKLQCRNAPSYWLKKLSRSIWNSHLATKLSSCVKKQPPFLSLNSSIYVLSLCFFFRFWAGIMCCFLFLFLPLSLPYLTWVDVRLFVLQRRKRKGSSSFFISMPEYITFLAIILNKSDGTREVLW